MTTLPEELIAEVLEHVENDEYDTPNLGWLIRQRTLNSAARASKTFNRIAEPILYRDMAVLPRFEGCMKRLRALFDRHERVQYVRHIAFEDGVWMVPMPLADKPSPLAMEMMSDMVDAIRSFGWSPTVEQTLTHAISHRSEEAAFWMLCCVCRNLRSLHFRIRIHMGYSRFSLMDTLISALKTQKPIAISDPPFPRLEHLVIESDPGHPLSSFSAVLEQSSLMSFRSWNLDCEEGFDGLCSNASKLELSASTFRSETMGELFDSFPSLTRLHLMDFSETGAWQEDPRAYALRIGDILRSRGGSLTQLYLREEESRLPNCTLGSLSELSALRELSISMNMLVNVREQDNAASWPRLSELLPASLEVLTLMDCTSCGTNQPTPQLREIMTQEQHHRLREIILLPFEENRRHPIPFAQAPLEREEVERFGWCMTHSFDYYDSIGRHLKSGVYQFRRAGVVDETSDSPWK